MQEKHGNSTSCMANHGNEGKITELNDGTWLVSIRNQRRGERYYNISTDRGKTWKGLKQWGELVEPGCNGDLYYYTSIVKVEFSFMQMFLKKRSYDIVKMFLYF